jgi:hypothetical protein
MGARTLAGALVPLRGVAPTNVNFVTGDYSRTLGLTGDAATKHLDSNRNNAADPQDENHNSVFVSTSPNTTQTQALMGAGFTNSGSNAILTNNLTNGVIRSRQATASTVRSISAPCLVGFSRLSSSSFDSRISGVGSTTSSLSQPPHSQNVFIFARGVAGVAQSWTSSTICFYSIGQAADLAALDARVTTLRNAIAAALA